MFALRARHFGHVRRRSAGSAPGEGRVLPRWLRRPARVLSRVGIGDFEPPRFAATLATAALFTVTAVYGTVAGGHSAAVVQTVTARTGFAISDVRVSGNRETSEIDVLQTVGLDGWTSLVGFDADAARERVAQLPWVESASVRKIYPSMLEVRLNEREPFAIWQHGSRLTIVERSGEPIAPLSSRRHASLPLVIGMGATEAGPDFIAEVGRHGDLAARVRAYIHVAERRWNLRFDNGVTVKLPKDGETGALDELARLDREHELLSRDITGIDMRLADRLTIALTPEAEEARETALEAQRGLRSAAELKI